MNYEFTKINTTRPKKKTRFHEELAKDEVKSDPISHFQINTFYYVIDTISIQLNERFNETQNGICKDLSLFSLKRIEKIKNKTIIPHDAF